MAAINIRSGSPSLLLQRNWDIDTYAFIGRESYLTAAVLRGLLAAHFHKSFSRPFYGWLGLFCVPMGNRFLLILNLRAGLFCPFSNKCFPSVIYWHSRTIQDSGFFGSPEEGGKLHG